MFKLIKLELYRNNLKVYFISALFIFMFILGLIYLTAFIPTMEATTRTLQSASVEIEIFSKYISIFMLILIVAMTSFSILSSVMYSRFVINDYLTEKVYLIFSYPIKRSKIFASKCILIIICNSIFFAGAFLGALLIFWISESIFHIVPDTLNLNDFILIFKAMIFMVLIANSVGIIGMRIGFWKKSVIVTIVSGVVIVSIFSNLVSNTFIPNQTLNLTFLGIVSLCSVIISILILIELSVKINKMEVL